jgi:hypothetical protein
MTGFGGMVGRDALARSNEQAAAGGPARIVAWLDAVTAMAVALLAWSEAP